MTPTSARTASRATSRAARPADQRQAAEPDSAARLRTVVLKISRRLNSLARGNGLTPSQMSALGVVARHGSLRLSELAEIESMNPTMLSRVVGALDDLGFIRRTPDPDDRRAALLDVTEAGQRIHEQLRTERGKIISSGLAQLSDADRHALEAALPSLEALASILASTTESVRGGR